MEFDSVYRSYRSTVRRRLLRYGVPERDVADATHDVFLIVHRKLSGFRGESDLGTWVTGICRRAASDYRRSARARYEVLDETPLDTAVFDERADAVVYALERKAAVHGALERIPERQRQVVRAFALEEMLMHDVAKRVAVPLQTAYARLYASHRALKVLLTALQ